MTCWHHCLYKFSLLTSERAAVPEASLTLLLYITASGLSLGSLASV